MYCQPDTVPLGKVNSTLFTKTATENLLHARQTLNVGHILEKTTDMPTWGACYLVRVHFIHTNVQLQVRGSEENTVTKETNIKGSQTLLRGPGQC